jgi:hypothetical protein
MQVQVAQEDLQQVQELILEGLEAEEMDQVLEL